MSEDAREPQRIGAGLMRTRGLRRLIALALAAVVLAVLISFVTSLLHPIHLTLGQFHLKCGLYEVGDVELPSSATPRVAWLHVGPWVYYEINWRTPYSVAGVTRDVRAGVHPGAAPDDARRWLRSRGFECFWDAPRDSSRLALHGYRPDQLSGIVSGRIRETNYDFMMVADLQISFFFDKQRRLINSVVEEEWTGP